MENHKLEFTCPFCRGELDKDADALECTPCGKRYFSLLGIYDFTGKYSTPGDLLQNDEKARILHDNYEKSDHAALLGIEEEYDRKWRDKLPGDIRELYADFSRGMMERGGERYLDAKSSAEKSGAELNYGSALDIGCSSGATLFHIARDFTHAAGIEPSFAKLILAKKYAEENGIENVTLACGYGEALPFRESSFDLVHALNVMEHFADQKKAVEIIHAVLKPGGVFSFDSRNRYDIFKPEPHVKVRFVGFLPKSLQEKYVHFMRKMEYRGIRLLSYFELSALMRPMFGKGFTISFPELTGSSASFGALYGILRRVPVISFLFKLVFPTYQVTAVKKRL